MRFIIRLFACLLLIIALAVLAWELWGLIAGAGYRPISTGELWFRIDSASLNGAQAGVQRYLHPNIWDPVIQTILTWPATLVFGLPGLLLMATTRPQRGGLRSQR